MWKTYNPEGILNAARESRKSFFRLHVFLRVKDADPTYFDREQSYLTRPLKTSNFETVSLKSFFRYTSLLVLLEKDWMLRNHP